MSKELMWLILLIVVMVMMCVLPIAGLGFMVLVLTFLKDYLM